MAIAARKFSSAKPSAEFPDASMPPRNRIVFFQKGASKYEKGSGKKAAAIRKNRAGTDVGDGFDGRRKKCSNQCRYYPEPCRKGSDFVLHLQNDENRQFS
ncbi:MAG: hypothetical protein Q4D62_03525 [Planctomycetia bacterium]|nr:hypothetical protein [Planctomycetia bacterium]